MAETERKPVKARVRIEGARLSFAQDLFRPGSFQGSPGAERERQAEPKYKANFLIPKSEGLKASYPFRQLTGDAMKLLKAAKIDSIEHKVGDIAKATFMERKIRPDKYAVRDGDLETWDGYEGQFYISASNTRPPKVLGRDRRVLTEADGVVYSGCYVNAIITLWHQPAGKFTGADGQPVNLANAVWASLEAVQFVRDGDPFSAAGVVDDSEFEDLTGGEADMIDDFGESSVL